MVRVVYTTHNLVLLILAVMLCGIFTSAQANVNLEWRSAVQIVHVGDQVNLGLYAVSDSGSNWKMSAMDVLVFNTPDYLSYLSLSSIGAPYNWLASGLLSGASDKLNDNIYDGEVMYSAWAQLGVPALASSSGLLVTTFQFTAEAVTDETDVFIPATYGKYSRTAIYDGTVPNLDVTGTRGTARVMIVPTDVVIVSSAAAVKSLPNETPVALVGSIVTRSFDNFFYMEDPDRTAGIRVNCIGTVPAEGSVPMVRGILRQLDGETVIDQASTGSGYAASIPHPYGITTKSTVSGLVPQGLLVTIAGTIGSGIEPGSIALQDGSSQPVILDLYQITPPEAGLFRIITGVLGAGPSGPVLRVNNQDDIRLAD